MVSRSRKNKKVYQHTFRYINDSLQSSTQFGSTLPFLIIIKSRPGIGGHFDPKEETTSGDVRGKKVLSVSGGWGYLQSWQ